MARSRLAVESRGEVELAGKRVAYEVRRTDRGRHLRLRIGPEPVVQIVAPRGMKLAEPRDILASQTGWIMEQLERIADRATPAPALTAGSVLPFRGRQLRLRVEKTSGDQWSVTYRGDDLIATGLEPRMLAAGLRAWYRWQARQALLQSAARWSQARGVSYGRLTVRDQRTRWGSCSSLGNLNFSWRLVMAPPEILDYVVIHELAHLTVQNHSRLFWLRVAQYCPDYKQYVEWLKRHGDELAAVPL